MPQDTRRDVEAVLIPEVGGTVKSFGGHRSFGVVSCDGSGGDGWFAAASLKVSSVNAHSLRSALSEEAFKQGSEVDSILFRFPAEVGDTLHVAWFQLPCQPVSRCCTHLSHASRPPG